MEVNGERRYLGYDPGDYTYDFGGTSSACPLVAGVCALILTANPDLTTRDVKEVIRTTARRIGGDSEYGQDGHSRKFGYGCIDANAAVARAIELREEVTSCISLAEIRALMPAWTRNLRTSSARPSPMLRPPVGISRIWY